MSHFRLLAQVHLRAQFVDQFKKSSTLFEDAVDKVSPSGGASTEGGRVAEFLEEVLGVVVLLVNRRRRVSSCSSCWVLCGKQSRLRTQGEEGLK